VTWMTPSLVWPSGSISMRSESLTRRNWQRIDRHDHHALVENVVVFDVCNVCANRYMTSIQVPSTPTSPPSRARGTVSLGTTLAADRCHESHRRLRRLGQRWNYLAQR
jgi:hypothetical protein